MFQGSIAALVTPMNERGQVDLPALRRLIDFHLENQTDALVIAGTTGEGATLDGEELRELLTTAIRHLDGRMPVIAGTGSPDTGKSIRLTSLAAGCGADAALVVTPYYNRPTQRGLEAHFAAIADATDIPIILYTQDAEGDRQRKAKRAVQDGRGPQARDRRAPGGSRRHRGYQGSRSRHGSGR